MTTPERCCSSARRRSLAGFLWMSTHTQMGAAELAALLQEYRGSYIMSFAGYNAGRGCVREVGRLEYGDPRDPKVDAVDWVERIPFAETRNYVQRVMENLQVYRCASAKPRQSRPSPIWAPKPPTKTQGIPMCKPINPSPDKAYRENYCSVRGRDAHC